MIANKLLEQCKRTGGLDSIHIKEWYVESRLGIKKYSELNVGKRKENAFMEELTLINMLEMLILF